MHQRLQEVTDYLARVRAALADVVANAPEAAFAREPEAGWTGAQIVQHLGRSEGAIAKMLERQFADAVGAGLPMDGQTDSVLHSLDDLHVADRLRRPLAAPSGLEPPRDAALGPSWESLLAVRERTLRAVATVDGRDLTRLAAPHPFFGSINGYQWVLFIGQHEERHLGQLRHTLGIS